ncbi:MAG: glutathione S-transferase family protein [Pseudomonadota bacterium]
MEIYGDLRSGNCLKVKMVADLLGLPYTWQDIDIMQGQSRTEQFLKMNPFGQVPVVHWSDGRSLAQSNAIIRYLAAGSRLLPEDPFAKAQVDQWLAWEQYSHEPYVAVCRFQMVYLNKPAEQREDWRVARGEEALDFMQAHLEATPWMVAGKFTIADISLLAYTQLAEQGGFDLAQRPAIEAWIARCREQLNEPTA